MPFVSRHIVQHIKLICQADVYELIYFDTLKMFCAFTNAMRIPLIVIVILSWAICDSFAGILERIAMVTYAGCKEKCESQPSCVHAVFKRRYTVCELYSTSSGVTDHVGTKRYWKSRELISEQTSRFSVCSNITDCTIDLKTDAVICQPSTCPAPNVILHADIFGNMLTTGSRVKYVC